LLWDAGITAAIPATNAESNGRHNKKGTLNACLFYSSIQSIFFIVILLVPSVLFPAPMLMFAIILTCISLLDRGSRHGRVRVIAAAHCRSHCSTDCTAYHRSILSADLIPHSRASPPADSPTQYRPQIAIVSCTTSQQ
jgi:hypothetical protein